MNKQKIAIVPMKLHLKFLYEELAKSSDCHGFVHTGIVVYDNELDATLTHIDTHCFGLRTVRDFFGFEAQAPLYMPGLRAGLQKLQPRYLVCFDFFHWYFLQSLRYVKRSQNCQIVLYSETKRWPTNGLSRVMMKAFFYILQRNSHSIAKVLVYTNEGKEWWQREMPEMPVEILAAPVDVQTFCPPAERQWVPDATLRILMNARYSAYKRHEDLLQAAAQLRAEGRLLHITLIGRADSGRERVEQLVTGCGLSEVVTFLDPLPMSEMPALYHQHDVLVLPSFNEAIGMVVPEAMACGVPTITSDTVGANVYVKEGETGWIHPTGDADALAAALRVCYDAPDLARRGAAARAHVAAHYSVPVIAERFLSLLDERS